MQFKWDRNQFGAPKGICLYLCLLTFTWNKLPYNDSLYYKLAEKS